MSNPYDPNKVYLITLAGGGDIERKIVNHETYYYVCDGGEPPEALVERYAKDNELTVNEAREGLRDTRDDNDRALQITGDEFNGKQFSGFSESTRDLMNFLKENDLDLSEDEYEGYIY